MREYASPRWNSSELDPRAKFPTEERILCRIALFYVSENGKIAPAHPKNAQFDATARAELHTAFWMYTLPGNISHTFLHGILAHFPMGKQRSKKARSEVTSKILSQRRMHLVYFDEIDEGRAMCRMIHNGTEISRRLWKMCAHDWMYERNMMSHLVKVMHIQDDEEYRAQCEQGLRDVLLGLYDRGIRL